MSGFLERQAQQPVQQPQQVPMARSIPQAPTQYAPQPGTVYGPPPQYHPQQYAPPSQLAPVVRRVPIWAWLLGGFLLLTMFGSIGGIIYALMPGDEPRDRDRSPVSATNPAEYFIVNYRNGMAQLYQQAAQRAEAGEFADVKAANEFINPNKESVKTESFAKMKKELEELNGENWSNGRAAETFERFSEGFSQ